MSSPVMTPVEYGIWLATQMAPATPEEIEAAARIMAGRPFDADSRAAA